MEPDRLSIKESRTVVTDWLVDVWCIEEWWGIDVFVQTIHLFDTYLFHSCHKGKLPDRREWQEIVCAAWSLSFKMLNGHDNHEDKLTVDENGAQQEIATNAYYHHISAGGVIGKGLQAREVHMLQAFDWQLPFQENVITAIDYDLLSITHIEDTNYQRLRMAMFILSYHPHFTTLDPKAMAAVVTELVLPHSPRHVMPPLTASMQAVYNCYLSARAELMETNHKIWQRVLGIPALSLVFNSSCPIRSRNFAQWNMPTQAVARPLLRSKRLSEFILYTPLKRPTTEALTDMPSGSSSTNTTPTAPALRPAAVMVH
jgi:hypothetical protein